MGWRVTIRTSLLVLHILCGLLLTPLVLTRGRGGIVRTRPSVTSWWHNRVCDILGVRITLSGRRPQAPAL